MARISWVRSAASSRLAAASYVARAAGLTGWDVAPGYYRIVASHRRCHAPGRRRQRSAVTPTLSIPPLAANVVIRLDCPHLRRVPTHIDMVRLPGSGTVPTLLVAVVVPERRQRAPTGTITFRSRRRLIKVVELAPDGGAAIGLPAAQAHAISASYSGDANFAPSHTRLR